MKKLFNELRFAIAFLTLLPIGTKELLPKESMAKSICFFPWVGFLFSFLSLACVFLNQYFDNGFFLAFIIILSHALLSGGLHLDALMDSHDGLAVSDRTQEEISKVIKDSRAGAFGAMSLVFAITAQIIFISQSIFSSELYIYLLIFIPVFSRLFLFLELCFFINQDKLGDKSSLRTFVTENKLTTTVIALASLVPILFFYPFNKICILVFLALALIFSFISYRFLAAKLKAQSGDSMGCGLVLNESFMYLLIFLFSRMLA